MATAKKLAAWTPEFRLSYPNLFDPREQDDGKLKYSMDMLFDKDTFDKPDFDKLKFVFNNCVPKEWLANNYEFVTFWKMFTNGDKKTNSQGEKKPELANQWLLRATALDQKPPTLLTANLRPATRADIYGGCYCKALLTAYSWEFKNKKGAIIKRGVSFSVEDVVKTRDGEAFGGGLSSEDKRAYYDEIREELGNDDVDELEDDMD